MPEVPFVLSLDSPTYYGHDIFPNRIYRQMHARQHIPLDMHTLGMIARLGAHAHHLVANKHNSGDLAALKATKESKDFEIHLDVGLFQPEELSVKLINDCIVVEGKHEEREDDHGHISRHFVRRYILPKDLDMEAIASTVSSDGVLIVRVPKLNDTTKEKERIIPIKQVGPSDLFVKTEHANGGDADKKEEMQKELSK